MGLVNQPPTLSNNLHALTRSGWHIDYYGPSGGGSYADKANRKIVIDQSIVNNPKQLVQTLAHESGHALYKADAYVPYTGSGLTRQQYIDSNTMSALKDEGEATLMNIQVRGKILQNGGPDIGVAGSQATAYVDIYNKVLVGTGDREKARKEIGKVFANKKRPSTDPSKTYQDYYAKTYEDFYDKDGENP